MPMHAKFRCDENTEGADGSYTLRFSPASKSGRIHQDRVRGGAQVPQDKGDAAKANAKADAKAGTGAEGGLQPRREHLLSNSGLTEEIVSEQFFRDGTSGSIELTDVNAEAAQFFVVGQSYNVTFQGLAHEQQKDVGSPGIRDDAYGSGLAEQNMHHAKPIDRGPLLAGGADDVSDDGADEGDVVAKTAQSGPGSRESARGSSKPAAKGSKAPAKGSGARKK